MKYKKKQIFFVLDSCIKSELLTLLYYLYCKVWQEQTASSWVNAIYSLHLLLFFVHVPILSSHDFVSWQDFICLAGEKLICRRYFGCMWRMKKRNEKKVKRTSFLFNSKIFPVFHWIIIMYCSCQCSNCTHY